MPKVSPSIIIVALIVGIGLGYAIGPEYQADMEQKSSGMTELGEADRWLDLRFIDGMIAHHLTAIDLSKQALENSSRPEIIELSQAIIALDEANIEELYTWKQQWYNNNRKITTFPKIHLGENDENFDLRFINAMISHHQEAINVSHEVQTKSTNNQVLTLASKVGVSLQQGIDTLIEWRQQWYQI
jgi:uncharacterized protein (DUF305 family)